MTTTPTPPVTTAAADPSAALNPERLPLLEHCSPRQRRVVARHLQLLDAEAGTPVIEVGRPVPGLLALLSGSARVVGPQGSVALTPGRHVGEAELLLDRPAAHAVVTDTDCRFAALSPRMFHVLVRDVPPVGRAVMESLALATRRL